MSRVSSIALLGIPVLLSGGMMSCNRQDPGLLEKVALLEAEVRERDMRISEMEKETAATAENVSSAVPDLDAARSAYSAFVEDLKGQLVEKLPEVKFERTSVFPIEGPDPETPIVSKVAFTVTASNGRTGEMIIPIVANTSGAWQEPSVEASISKLKTSLTAPAVANHPQKSSDPPPTVATPPKTSPRDVMGADRTVDIQWNEPAQRGQRAAPPTQGVPTQQPATPPPSSGATRPTTPKKVMPTDRDVIIDFE